MMKKLKIALLSIAAIIVVLVSAYLRVYGVWTTMLISILLVFPLIQAISKKSKLWIYLTGFVLASVFIISCMGTRVRHIEGGRIQIVHTLYPLCPKVYIEGTSVDTIDLATGYGTFAGWYYNVSSSTYYAVKDTNDLTTIICFPNGRRVKSGRHMVIREYEGPHGKINIFTYYDDNGNKKKEDYYGKDPDDPTYTVGVYDNADCIPQYIP